MTDNPFIKPIDDGRITDMQVVVPKVHDDGNYLMIVLDRIEHGETPDYCIHGKVTCHRCDDWCWLGDETYRLVTEEQALALCRQCAAEVVQPGMKPIRNAGDHRRADGLH